MSGINQVILVGRIGRDPESHDTAGGKMAFFSMATLADSRVRMGNRRKKPNGTPLSLSGTPPRS